MSGALHIDPSNLLQDGEDLDYDKQYKHIVNLQQTLVRIKKKIIYSEIELVQELGMI